MFDSINDIKTLVGAVSGVVGLLGGVWVAYKGRLKKASQKAAFRQRLDDQREEMKVKLDALEVRMAQLEALSHNDDIRYAKNSEILEGVVKNVEDLTEDIRMLLSMLISKH